MSAGGSGPHAGLDAPGVLIHPPLLFAAMLLLGLALHRWHPLGLPVDGAWASGVPGGERTVWYALGVLLIALGGAGAAAAARRMWRAGTGIPTFRPATALVTEGLFRYSRNPIYAAGVVVQAGIALLFGDAWLLVLLAPLVGILNFGVIDREESYLERKFGQPYRDYCTRVRRWL